MGSALEPHAPQPLNARRPAAPPLPTFELPAPTFSAAPLKYPHQSHPLNPPHLPPPNSSVSNLISSQTTQAGDASASATAATSTTVTASTITATTGAASGTAVSASPEVTSYWATQGSYSGPAGRQPSWTAGLGSSYSSRDPFSPSFNPTLHRNPATSPPGADTIPPAYDMNQLPPFQQPLGSGPPSHPMLGAHPHPPLPANDPYMPKSSSAPAYGGAPQLSNPPGGPYQPYGGPPPPLGIHPTRVASNPPPPPPPHLSYQRQPWPSYSLPAMTGPVMSNVHSPGGQMSLLGPLQSGLLPGFNSGHAASMQQMYGGHPPHPGHGSVGPTNDRPFKCDQCPQSFNRNHDLKRHRRIHLSVKPYPCHHCDKSFSRKDALKRHRLVKGCGSGESEEAKPIKEEDKNEGASEN
ncbi:putative C2H2 finger domain protein [Aspergillus lucknowensis]|uniref:C2H2-type domain-containing protein n=1 Tax=Aspergillus lucknowensis TaxID=176173 RepID=A0ABR4M4Q9_9EURO